MPIVEPLEVVQPEYRIFRYTDKIYKLVKYKRRNGYCSVRKKTEQPKHQDKLAASIARTRRVILEYALCNYWEYFCTFTIGRDKFDRSDLNTWRDTFLQWIRDQRKKGVPVVYLLVPEQHKDGSWHMHGFLTGVQSELVSFKDERKKGLRVPDKLVNGNFFDWPAYREKFGFCSLAPIRDRVSCAFYVLKYITKDMGESAIDVGLHLYYASRGLNRSELQVEVYESSQYLDSFLENDYKFCKTGMTKTKDHLNWSFGIEYGVFEPLFESEALPDVEAYCDDVYEMEQITFDDYSV